MTFLSLCSMMIFMLIPLGCYFRYCLFNLPYFLISTYYSVTEADAAMRFGVQVVY